MGFYNNVRFVFVTNSFHLSAYIWEVIVVMLKDRILTLRYKNEHESRKAEEDNYSQFKVEIKEPSIFMQ